MSQWIERIRTHPVWEELNSLGASIDLALAREGNDAEVIDGLERIRAVLAFCGKRLAATDPALIEPRPLNTLASNLSLARRELEAYVSDGIAAHITAANAKTDEVLSSLPSILAAISTDDITAINESISSYRTTLKKYLQEALIAQQEVAEASEENEAKITALESTLAAEQSKIAGLVLDYQTQFSTSQDKRASEFSAALTDQQSKFSATTAEQQTQFSKDQDARKSDYAASQLANQEKFANLISDYAQKLKDQENDFAEKLEAADKTHEANLALLKLNYEASAQEILNHVNARKKEVEKLVGVIGNLGVTSGYKKVADSAKGMLYLWQGITVSALVGLIFIAYQMAFPTPGNSIAVTAKMPEAISSISSPTATQTIQKAESLASSQTTVKAAPEPTSDAAFYQGLATRIFLSLTFGVFAAYAARQASHFLEMERKNRKMALELEALGPYIAPLDKAQQDEFRLKVGDRSFGVNDNVVDKPKSDDPVTPSDVLTPKGFAEFVTNLAKGLK